MDTDIPVYCRYCYQPLTRLPITNGVAYVDAPMLTSIFESHQCGSGVA